MRTLAQLLLTVLLNASWQIAVVAVFAACCSWLLRETAAWCRHSIWVAAILISLCLPILSGLNALEFSPITKQKVTRIETEEPGSRPAGLQEIDLAGRTMGAVQMPIEEPARRSGWISPINLNRNLAVTLAAFYALFILYRSFKLMRAWRRTRAIMRNACSVEVSGRAAAIIERCQTAIGVRRVRVVCSTSVPVPITAGVFKPLIILPAHLSSEIDEEILLSAIGHEFVHVVRRDYILNLIYEVIYLPLSFHPAAALMRRRIKETRELCCDELVAEKLMKPDVYARSLVRLLGSVPIAGRLAPNTTIGITDADILEVRIMSLLKTSKLSARRNTLLLIAASLLLATPCVAAAAFALQFDVNNPEVGISQQQDQRQEASQKLERALEELQRKERELTERMQKNPSPQGQELESLRRLESELQEASAKINHEQEAQHLKEAEQELKQVDEKLAQIIATHPVDEASMRETQEKLAQLQRSFPENEEKLRELREQLAMIEKQYPNANAIAEYLQRAQAEIQQQKDVLTKEEREKIEERFKYERLLEDSAQDREAREKKEAAERKVQNKIKNKEYEKEIRKDGDMQIRKELEEAGRADRAKEQAELTRLAAVSMDRAIQIAISQYPGKVLSCSLGRQKDGQPYYRLVIINDEGEKSSATHVWVSATDGQILKTEQE
jgi:beta-lactamase regulating signal transducer with metallopeptidase domain/uncharacterized membrane protein YkoI